MIVVSTNLGLIFDDDCLCVIYVELSLLFNFCLTKGKDLPVVYDIMLYLTLI